MEQSTVTTQHREPWNKSKLVGQMRIPLKMTGVSD